MRKSLLFGVLACSVLVMGIAFAADFEPLITSTPAAQENTAGEQEVTIFLNNGIVFEAGTNPEGLLSVEWSWNFASSHLNCVTTEEAPHELSCDPLTPGRSAVTVTAKRNGLIRESAPLFVMVTDGDDPVPEPEVPEICTEEYAPVCGLVQVTCVTTPCDPVPQTFPNRCHAEAAGATAIVEGACEGDGEGETSLPPASYEDDVLLEFAGYDNPFSDTDMARLSGMAAAEMYRRGAMTGYGRGIPGMVDGPLKGEFKGSKLLNRAEALKVLFEMKNVELQKLSVEGKFSDVHDGEWFSLYVAHAAQMGIIQGYEDGTFRPSAPVTTAEFLKMLFVTLGVDINDIAGSYYEELHDPISREAWYVDFASFAVRYDLLPTRGGFMLPNEDITRQDVAIAVYQYLKNRNSVE